MSSPFLKLKNQLRQYNRYTLSGILGMMHMVKFTGVFVAAVCAFILFGGGKAFAQKIDTSRGSFSLPDNASLQVQLQLDAPIICSQQAQTCNVVLNLVVSDPSRVQLDTSTVTWNDNEWSQPRTITVSAIASPTYDDGQTVTISANAVSSAAYYSGFAVSMSAILPSPPAPGLTNQSVNVVSDGGSVTTDVLSTATNSPDPSTLSIVSAPTHGHATDPPGTITYTPDKGYAGSDSLEFQVCSSLDNQVCSTGVLSFNVSAPATVANSTQSIPSAPDTGARNIGDRSLLIGLLFLSGSTLGFIGTRKIRCNEVITPS